MDSRYRDKYIHTFSQPKEKICTSDLIQAQFQEEDDRKKFKDQGNTTTYGVATSRRFFLPSPTIWGWLAANAIARSLSVRRYIPGNWLAREARAWETLFFLACTRSEVYLSKRSTVDFFLAELIMLSMGKFALLMLSRCCCCCCCRLHKLRSVSALRPILLFNGFNCRTRLNG